MRPAIAWGDPAFQIGITGTPPRAQNFLNFAPVKQPAKNLQLDKEAERLRQICPSRAFQIALDERGESWSTMDLADKLDRWRAEHADIAFYIGGADGLDARIVADANCRWSLSRLTLPHQLVRVVLIEQLYRGWTVLQNHPYHRA